MDGAQPSLVKAALPKATWDMWSDTLASGSADCGRALLMAPFSQDHRDPSDSRRCQLWFYTDATE